LTRIRCRTGSNHLVLVDCEIEKMAADLVLSVGQKFSDFTDFTKFFETYCRATRQLFCVSYSRSVSQHNRYVVVSALTMLVCQGWVRSGTFSPPEFLSSCHFNCRSKQTCTLHILLFLTLTRALTDPNAYRNFP